jgi:hypothetical protein
MVIFYEVFRVPARSAHPYQDAVISVVGGIDRQSGIGDDVDEHFQGVGRLTGLIVGFDQIE